MATSYKNSQRTSKGGGKKQITALTVVACLLAGAAGGFGAITSYDKLIKPAVTHSEQVDSTKKEISVVTKKYIDQYLGVSDNGAETGIIMNNIDTDEIASQAASLVSADLITKALNGLATKEELAELEAKITSMIGTYEFSDSQVHDLALAVSAIIEADLDALNQSREEETALTQAVLEKINELEGRLKAAEENIDALQQTVATIQGDVEALKQRGDSDYATASSVTELTQKYNELMVKYQEQTGSISDLVTNNAGNVASLETLSTNLTTMQTNLTTMQTGIEQQIKALQTAVNGVQNDTGATDQIAVLESQSKEQEAEIETLNTTIEQLTDKLSSLNASAGDTQTQIAALNDKATKLSADISTLSGGTTTQVENLQTQVNASDQKITDLKQQIADTNATIVALETRLASTQADYDNKLVNMQASNTNVSGEQALALEAQIANANQEIANLQAQLEEARRDYDTKITQANNANAEANNKILELENEIANSNADVTNLQKELNDSINDYNQKIADTDALSSELNNQISELQNRLTQANTNMALLQDELTEAQEDYNAQFGTTHVSAETLQGDIQSLNEELNTAKANLVTLESNLASARADYNTQIASIEAAAAVTEGKVTSLETDLARQGASIEDLQTELSATNDQLATLRNSLSDTDSQINAVEADLTTTKASLTNTQNELAVAQRTITSLQEATSGNTTDIGVLQGDVTELNEALETISEQKADLAALQDLVTKMVTGLGGNSSGNLMDSLDPDSGFITNAGDITIATNALKGLKDTCADLSSRVAALEQRTDALEEKTRNIASGAGVGTRTNIGSAVEIGDNVTVPFSLQKQGDTYGYVTEDGTFVDFKSQYDITSAVTDAMVGDATEDKVLEGYTFTNETQTGLTGTIPLKAAEIYTPGQNSILLEAGQYLDGDQLIRGDANLSAENIRYGVSMFDIDGTFTADGTIRPSHILAGKVGYSQGNQVVGSMQTLSSEQFEGKRNSENNYEVRPKFNGYVPAQTLVNTLAATTIQAGAQSDGTFKYSIEADKYTGAGSSGSIAKLTPAYSANSSQNNLLSGGTVTLAANTYIKDQIVITGGSMTGTYGVTGTGTAGASGQPVTDTNKVFWDMGVNNMNRYVSVSKLVTDKLTVSSGTYDSVTAGGTITIPANYYVSSDIKITTKTLASQTGVDSGKTAVAAAQMLTGYQGWVNGSKITGSMANNGAWGDTLNTGKTSVTVPAGYHNGSGKVTITTQSKSATPTGSAQTINPDSGKVLSSVSIAAVTTSSGIGKTCYDSGRTQGQNDVKNSPNSYSLYTKTQYDNNYSSGRTQGQNDVKNSPNSYSLYTSTQYTNYGTTKYNEGYSAGKTKITNQVGLEIWHTNDGSTYYDILWTGWYLVITSGNPMVVTSGLLGSNGGGMWETNIQSTSLDVHMYHIQKGGKISVPSHGYYYIWVISRDDP